MNREKLNTAAADPMYGSAVSDQPIIRAAVPAAPPSAGKPAAELPFPDEIDHLAFISEKLEEALKQADDSVDRRDREYMETKSYMVEYRGEIDPHEMFQTELLLNQTDRSGAFAVEMRGKLSRLKDSPYFARIDFLEAGTTDPTVHYIGRYAFSHDDELLIFDWRAPIAGMYYDCQVGPAGYDAPAGRIEGALTRKRQFKIKDGVMEYALESADNVQDDILQRELSHTSDEKMKSIISTIQAEQNRIIRNEKAKTLIIQGVAGSGKTSIALHRIAFLLYRFQDRLNAKNVAILSPNKVFGDYISNVIPELGEEPIYEMSFADIAAVQLEGIVGFEADKDPLETPDEEWRQRARFRSTMEFVSLMDGYIKRMPDDIFSPGDYAFGRFTVEASWLQSRYRAYGSHPVKRRLSMLADDIRGRLESDNFMQEDLPGSKAILKSLTAMLSIKDSLALYQDLYKQSGAAELLVLPAKKTLEWIDVYPFLYLHNAFAGLKESKLTKHLVIDEMQDYTPIQYAVLNLLFRCQKTILGDFGQSVNPNQLHTLDDIRRLYADAEFVTLNKSYRSTCEIIRFAGEIGNTSLDAVERHGREPSVIFCCDEQAELEEIKKAVRSFQTGNYASLGIILKTNIAARELFERLSAELDVPVQLISPESSSFRNGVSITSVQMSKGLEFDQVVIPRASRQTYCSEYDRGLLYIACTRAMHELTLLFSGAPTEFIRGNYISD